MRPTSFSAVVFGFYRLLPPKLRYSLKTVAGLNGHHAGFSDKLIARRDADGKKRLDRVLHLIVDTMVACNLDATALETCLEVGAGYVPTDALAMFLLGANKVVITDYNNIADFSAVKHAVDAADMEEIQKILDRYAIEGWQGRLSLLLEKFDGTLVSLAGFHITYLAPFDLSCQSLDGHFSFVHSISVLEHIPKEFLRPILDNLMTSLIPTGVMVHDIDLRDHRGMDSAPYDFLLVGSDYDPQKDVDGRGNRIRASQWETIFSTLPKSKFSLAHVRNNKLPAPDVEALLPEFSALDSESLRIGSMVICLKKQ